ncbi:MAG: response regulator transcription factor [Bacteroidales bacterium]|nr:response regulator transcription factor [Bacteroidales bacterium]
MPKKILIVDDEQDICEILEFNLANEGFDITCANSAEEALEKITSDHVLVLLDVMMSGMSGFKMAEKLRKENNRVPIIFLTAKDTENDMLTGFSVGGDDYISKPFSIKEVIARVKAVLKRHNNLNPSTPTLNKNKLIFGDLTIDSEIKETFVNGESISLTKTEFEILTLLATHPTRIFRREDMIEHLWKDAPYVTERTVDVHITRLRKKLGKMANLISSRSGYGYRFKLPTL